MNSKEKQPEAIAPLTDLAGSPQAAQALRRHAEEIARKEAAMLENFPPEEIRSTLHELRVHQIELEMQNQELRRAQVELDAARERYFNLYNLAPVGYVTVSEKGLISEANLTAATLLGVTRSDLIRQPLSRFIRKADQDIWYLHCKQMIRDACSMYSAYSPRVCELRMTKQDGTEFRAHLTATAEQNDDGNPVHRIVISDITERKRMEDTLRESEKRFRTIFETALEGIWLIDSQAKTVMVNQCMADMLGYTVTEMQDRPLFEFMTEPQAEEARGYFARRMQGIEEQHEFCFQRKDGSQLWAIVSTCPVMSDDGTMLYAYGMITDITGRKRMEEMLRQKAEKYHSFVETMKEGFIVVRANMTVAYVNDEFCKMALYEINDLIGSSILHYFDPENQKTVKNYFRKRKQGDATPYTAEAIRKDGTRINLKISPRPLFDADGNFQGSFAVITDMTHEKKTVNHLKQQAETVQKQKDELAREVESYNHAMRVLLKNKEAEVREVEVSFVTNVRNAVKPMLDRLKNTSLNDSQKQLVEVIESRVNSIVSPFIRRVKAEEWDFTPMEIEIASLIREGKRNKEIAEFLNISESTVGFHRSGIRRKLALKNKKINLRTYLSGLDANKKQ